SGTRSGDAAPRDRPDAAAAGQGPRGWLACAHVGLRYGPIAWSTRLHGCAAVDAQDLPRNPGGVVRREIRSGLADVGRLADAAQGDRLRDTLADELDQAVAHVGAHEAGRDAGHAHAGARYLLGNDTHQRVHAGLRDVVRRAAGSGDVRTDRRDEK